MNEYKDKKLTVDDLEKSEVGSTFTGCTFIANEEKKPISRINFCYAVFNDCKFKTYFKECIMLSASGNTLPNKKKTVQCNTRNMGDAKARERWLKDLPTDIRLYTDATDTYRPHEGVPDIPADGKSICTITIQKTDKQGNDLNGKKDNDTITLDTTRGALSALEVKLVKGKAEVTLRSAPETCLTTVTAKSPDAQDELQIQFAPIK